MGETDESLLNIVNASGFLFQMKVAEEIRISKWNNTRWKIAAEEHRWVDKQSGEEGFIDIVLQSGLIKLVIECKRVRDGNWIFLVDEFNNYERVKNRVLWTLKVDEKKVFYDWDELTVSPDSLESTFCVVRGTGEDSKPMLETIAGKLLRSLEALALEELRIVSVKSANHQPCIYIPVIITNANLWVCSFKYNDVELSTGELPSEKYKLKPVQYLRFRNSVNLFL